MNSIYISEISELFLAENKHINAGGNNLLIKCTTGGLLGGDGLERVELPTALSLRIDELCVCVGCAAEIAVLNGEDLGSGHCLVNHNEISLKDEFMLLYVTFN